MCDIIRTAQSTAGREIHYNTCISPACSVIIVTCEYSMVFRTASEREGDKRAVVDREIIIIIWPEPDLPNIWPRTK